MIPRNEIKNRFWRPRPRWRWYWWGFGFRMIFFIITTIILFAWIYTPDPDLANTLLIVLIILIIVNIILLIVFAVLASRRRSKRPPPAGPARRAAIRERARAAGMLVHCTQCGREIRRNAQYCEFCGSKVQS